MKLVQRLPIPLEVASGVDIASGTQSALLARQKAANDGAERFVGCAHAGLGSLGSGIVAKPDFHEKIASSLARLGCIEDLGRADRHAALPAAERVLHDEGTRAACSQSQAEARHVVIEDDCFAFARWQGEPFDAGLLQLHAPSCHRSASRDLADRSYDPAFESGSRFRRPKTQPAPEGAGCPLPPCLLSFTSWY